MSVLKRREKARVNQRMKHTNERERNWKSISQVIIAHRCLEQYVKKSNLMIKNR